MRKTYPYLSDSYVGTEEEGLTRREFLSKLDSFVNQKRYARLTLLNWAEEPLKEIQGEIVSGSLSKDGSSAVRVTGNLTTTVDAGTYSIDDANMDFAINKKIFVEVGVKNETDQYREYPILWFPQGVFFIKAFSCNSSTSTALNLSLTISDKMSMLNGDVGGTFPSTVILDEQDTQSDTGDYVTEKVLVYNIIQELVHHWGGEDLNNIVIENVPTRIKRIMRWGGDTPLYLVSNGGQAEAGTLSYDPTTTKPNSGSFLQINNGDDAGYVYDDFVYDSELTMTAGQTVVNALDSIKQYLGNYEYYYDCFGVFHFREIRNYLNTTQGKIIVDDMKENDYLVDRAIPKEEFTFSDAKNLISMNVNPQYDSIKNDFTVHGTRKGTNDSISYDVFYHLVIDSKPSVGNIYTNLLLYRELDTDLQCGVFPITVLELPSYGEFNSVYKVGDKAYVWTADSVWKEVKVEGYYTAESPYITKDWRTELYLRGLQALANNSIDRGYYFEELRAFWPQIYDLKNQRFWGEGEDPSIQARVLTDGDYYLDFIDSSGPLGKYSVSNIGRRTDVVNEDDVNCLFEPEIPNIVFLNLDLQDSDPEKLQKLRAECMNSGQPYAQTRGEVFKAFSFGGYHNGAFDHICSELYKHTTYQTTISMTAIPNYWLEPNTRIRIADNTTKTFGSYMVQNISVPLAVGGVMSVTANECVVQR